MKNQAVKKFSLASATIVITCLAGLAVLAMFVGDEQDEFVDFVKESTKRPQPMELTGKWLGMRVTSINSGVGREFGIPPGTDGVVVTEVSKRMGFRARQAGVMGGDIITSVDGAAVGNIADLYDVSRKQDVSQAVMLEVERWGQPMTLVLPASVPTVPQQGQPMQGRTMQGQVPGQMIPPGQMQNRPMGPRGPGAGRQMGGIFSPMTATPQQAAFQTPTTGQRFTCPLDRLVFAQSSVHPHYRCPRCNGPLTGVR